MDFLGEEEEKQTLSDCFRYIDIRPRTQKTIYIVFKRHVQETKSISNEKKKIFVLNNIVSQIESSNEDFISV